MNEMLQAQIYSVEEIDSATNAKILIDMLVTEYRFSSAIRFSMFVNIDNGNFGQSGKLYFVSSSQATNNKHFDLVFICSNGVICSTCNEYMEYGMYDRHILALFINGFIELSPLHQCSTYWMRNSINQNDSLIMIKDWFRTSAEKSIKCQTVNYDVHSCFDTALLHTKSAYAALNDSSILSIEKAMASIKPEVLKSFSALEESRKILHDIYSLKIHHNKELMAKLKLFHEECLRSTRSSSNKADEPQSHFRNKSSSKRKQSFCDGAKMKKLDNNTLRVHENETVSTPIPQQGKSLFANMLSMVMGSQN